MSMKTQHHRSMAGATLIEVMVALFVLAIGLLGFLGMQANGITAGRKAYTNSQAAFLAESMVERIRANRANISAYPVNFGEAVVASVNCKTATCTGTQMSDWDTRQWLDQVAALLPAGEGQIEITPVGTINRVVIKLKYRLDNERSDLGATSEYTYTLKTEI